MTNVCIPNISSLSSTSAINNLFNTTNPGESHVSVILVIDRELASYIERSALMTGRKICMSREEAQQCQSIYKSGENKMRW